MLADLDDKILNSQVSNISQCSAILVTLDDCDYI